MVSLNKKSSSDICENCNHHNCCKKSSPFLTKEEKKKHLIEYNCKCSKLIDDKCSIYGVRPIDCRIFPITILKVDGKFYWGLSLNCPLSDSIDISKELEVIEKIYLPKLKEELDDYHSHPWDEWFQKVKVIGKVNI